MTSTDLSKIREVRSLLVDVLRSLPEDPIQRADGIAAFNLILGESAKRRAISPETLTWSWVDQSPVTALLDPIVIDIAAIITGDTLSRLKHCPSCDWLFEDQTRNGRRRWCDMADCGSRSKSKAHYYRNKTSPASD